MGANPSWRKRILSSPKYSERPWSPTRPVFNVYRSSFPREKLWRKGGRGKFDHTPPSGADVNELSSTATPSVCLNIVGRDYCNLYILCRSVPSLRMSSIRFFDVFKRVRYF